MAPSPPCPDKDFGVTAGVAVAFVTGLGGVATAYGVGRAVGGFLERRRMARWDHGWERVEPGWVTLYGH
ncbi:hypothetical protein KUM39_25415 [Streptomyces sp. J2-1]|uniref:hypothetical protein n=1 Tax=Streptomyces corallincola TaxID=2851888 RepID=UPI001C38B08D|nr:hypothetical protein [Streptomyces corallincola]MBV2357657.1 hypothetical protein [Streptomyces corallincola]